MRLIVKIAGSCLSSAGEFETRVEHVLPCFKIPSLKFSPLLFSLIAAVEAALSAWLDLWFLGCLWEVGDGYYLSKTGSGFAL